MTLESFLLTHKIYFWKEIGLIRRDGFFYSKDYFLLKTGFSSSLLNKACVTVHADEEDLGEIFQYFHKPSYDFECQVPFSSDFLNKLMVESELHPAYQLKTYLWEGVGQPSLKQGEDFFPYSFQILNKDNLNFSDLVLKDCADLIIYLMNKYTNLIFIGLFNEKHDIISFLLGYDFKGVIGVYDLFETNLSLKASASFIKHLHAFVYQNFYHSESQSILFETSMKINDVKPFREIYRWNVYNWNSIAKKFSSRPIKIPTTSSRKVSE